MQKDVLKIKGMEGFGRDAKTGAIVSTDKAAYEEFVAKRQREKSFEDRLNTLEEKMHKILEALNG